MEERWLFREEKWLNMEERWLKWSRGGSMVAHLTANQ
jgi:hypothetical protein